jgi:hypothetical protein
MTKSPIHQSLERTAQGNSLNPDNHDQVHIALGLLSAESDEKNREVMDNLTGQISGLTHVLSTTMEQQVKKLIESNDEASELNKVAIFWSKWLTVTLIAVTLIVGLLQVYVIWKTAEMQHATENKQQITG